MGTPDVDDAIATYDRHAARLAPRYAGLGAERFLRFHRDYLPEPPGPILDVGAGSGVHAAGLVALGHDVLAAEPSAGMRAEAARLFPDAGIEWVDDRLPGLAAVRASGRRFRFILVNAVWMHVPPGDRDQAMDSLAVLSQPGAILSAALRHGPAPADRPMHDADPDDFADLAARHDFILEKRSEHPTQMNDPGVSFFRLVLRRTDTR